MLFRSNGQTNDNSWDDPAFNGDETLDRLKLEGNNTKLAFFHTAKLTILYYFGNYKEAIAENEILLKYKDNILGELSEVLHAFYTALSISAYYDDLTKKEKRKYLKVFKKHLKDLEFWSQGCPANYEQHYLLLKAELFSIENKFENATIFYLKAKIGRAHV